MMTNPATTENKTTTAVLLSELKEPESKRQARETPVVNVKVNYLSCPSLQLAVNILKKDKDDKKDNKSATQLFDELEHKYSFVCTSENPEQPTPGTIYIKVVNDGIYYEILDQNIELSHIGVIEWKDLPENFPRSYVKIINSASECLSIILANTPVGNRTVTLSIEHVMSLFNEFDKYSAEKKEHAAAHALTLTPKKAKAYLEEADELARDEQLIFEQARAYLMQVVLEQLNRESITPKIETPTENPEVSISNTPWNFLKFFIVMFVQYAPMIFFSLFNASESMASLTPYLFFFSPHVLTALGVICALNMVGGTICFYGPDIMKWFRINFTNTVPPLHSVYQQQLETAEAINKQLLAFDFLPFQTHQEYYKFSKAIGNHLCAIPSQAKKDSLLATMATAVMTVLTGIEALSNAVFLGAMILGLILCAFTFSTLTPPIMAAFVASHALGVLLLSVPIGSCHALVHYITRITSASRLFDLDKDARNAVEQKRSAFVDKNNSINQQLNNRQHIKNEHEETQKNKTMNKPYLVEIKNPELKGKLDKLQSKKSESRWLRAQTCRSRYFYDVKIIKIEPAKQEVQGGLNALDSKQSTTRCFSA